MQQVFILLDVTRSSYTLAANNLHVLATPRMIDMQILVSVLDQHLGSVLVSFRDGGLKFTGKFEKPYDDFLAVYERLDITVKITARKGKKPYEE